ncbi:MAG: hypothetical protein IKM11_04490 [Oscillospiraceae bacterium]|nr:hypothetical protein [Oscillospiraceae bacterium]
MLLLKFGKKEHLQQLKDGVVHFRPLSSFAGDSTRFRGDRLEGRLLLDLSHPFLINGVDYAPYAKEIVLSYEGVDSILSFSAAMLSYENCHVTKDGLFTPNDDFIEEMLQFGEHVLIFCAEDFLEGMRQKIAMHRCNCLYRSIFYCDKTSHKEISDYFEERQNAGEPSDPYDYCFIKDKTPYSKQNEWRIIIHDTHNEFPIESSGGVNVETKFRTHMPIFETLSLKTLVASEEYLK